MERLLSQPASSDRRRRPAGAERAVLDGAHIADGGFRGQSWSCPIPAGRDEQSAKTGRSVRSARIRNSVLAAKPDG